MPTPKNYVRFHIETSDPSLTFLIDCQKGEDILARAEESISRWQDGTLRVVTIEFVCILRY